MKIGLRQVAASRIGHAANFTFDFESACIGCYRPCIITQP